MKRRAASCLAAAGAFTLTLASPVSAQGLPAYPPVAVEPEPACLGLERAVADAVSRDFRIRRAEARRDGAEARIAVEQSARRPQISSFVRSGVGQGLRAENEFDNRVGIRGSQLIYDFGRTGLAVSAARKRAQSEEEQVRLAQLDTAFEVGERMIAMSRNREKIAVAAEIENYFARDAAEVDRRLELGLLKASEASGIRAEFARAKAQSAEARLHLEQERTALASLVGYPVMCAAVEEADRALRVGQPSELDIALDEAEQTSPLLAGRRAEIEAAKFDARRSQRENLPSLSLAGTSAVDAGSAFDGVPASRLGFDVSMPIYQGGEVRARTTVANAETRFLDFQYEEERRVLAEDVTIGWIRVRDLANIASLELQNAFALALQSAATEREYREGLVTLTELIEIRRDEYQGQVAEIDTRHDLMLERLRLLYLTGRVLSLN